MSSDSVDKETSVDDCAEDELAPGSSVPVGITIAYKRQEQGFTEEKMRHTPKSSSVSKKKKPGFSSSKKKTPEKSRRKSNSFQVFLESAAIYALCLILPTIFVYLYNWWDIWKYQRETGTALPEEESLWYAYVASSPNYQWLSNTVYKPVADYVCVDNTRMMGNDGRSESSSYSYAWSLVTSVMEKTGMCPLTDPRELAASRKRSVLSEDVTAYTDVFTIAVCAFLLAFIRISIIRITVPIDDAVTLEAMVRCKSVHLLSSDYVVTPAGTPLVKRRSMTRLSQDAMTPLMLPNLNSSAAGGVMSQDDLDNSEMFGYNIDATTEREDDPPVRMHAFAVGEPALSEPRLSKLSNRLQNVAEGQAIDEDPGNNSSMANQSIDDKDDGFDSALLLSLTAALNTTTTTTSGDESAAAGSGNRMYAAPRYATALFRLLYSTAAAAIALYYFRDADFWPWFVFGHGQTEKCWDLSGGLTVGMDSDFDQRNAVLKRYFLWQASYHWHSGAFHILSLLTLLLHPTKHAPRRFLSFRRGSSAYVRSLSQHVLAVALIAVAYIFSSLRRLGAIGLFAFDVSSWFLHFLQVCINAPEDSRWRRNAVISRIYWGLVIPSFVVTRFAIWPAIWYSASFESTKWLTQLEKTLWPGSAALLRNVFNLLMVILHAMSVIYFRRLLNHPHLQRILRQELPPSERVGHRHSKTS